MNHRAIAVAAIAILTLAGCNQRKDADAMSDPPAAGAPDTSTTPAGAPSTATTPPVGQPAPAPEGGARASSGDDIALGLLAAVDEHEIAAAKQAQEKKVTGPAMDYAKMMEKEHGDNLAQTKALGTLADTPDIKELKGKGDKDLAELGQQSGKAYEAAYIDAMIAGHRDALALIDGKMMSSASTDPVKQHLTETRAHVAAHLAKAEQIKGAM